MRHLRNFRLCSISRSMPFLWTLAISTSIVHAHQNREQIHPVGSPTRNLFITPSSGNPRNSEGDMIQLRDGKWLLIYSRFTGKSDDDDDRAELASRYSSDGGKHWSSDDVIVARPEDAINLMSVTLTRISKREIGLFYLRKRSVSDCRPVLRRSTDEGKTWSEPAEIISDEVGYYVLNNNRVIRTKKGRWIVPVALHKGADGKFISRGKAMCYLSDDGKNWHRSRTVLEFGKNSTGLQEPGVIECKDGSIMMWCRTNSGVQVTSRSTDGGETWTPVEPSNIRSPLAPASIKQIPGKKTWVMVWNDNYDPKAGWSAGNRTPLTVAVSQDEGKTWEHKKVLEDDPEGWYCYTSIHFDKGAVLLSHCSGRRKKGGLNTLQVTRFEVDWLTDKPK